jgi:hypothetical protein
MCLRAAFDAPHPHTILAVVAVSEWRFRGFEWRFFLGRQVSLPTTTKITKINDDEDHHAMAGTVDDLEWTSEDEADERPSLQCHPAPSSIPAPAVFAASTSSSEQQRPRHRIPGPAGMLTGLGLPTTTTPQARGEAAGSGAGLRFFEETAAWKKLLAMFSDEDLARRMTLKEVISAASVPPCVPVRVPLSLMMVTELVGDRSDPIADIGAVVADETGEMAGTFHYMVFQDRPNKVKVGSACAFRNVPVLTLSAWSHHLILHAACIVYVVEPDV